MRKAFPLIDPKLELSKAEETSCLIAIDKGISEHRNAIKRFISQWISGKGPEVEKQFIKHHLKMMSAYFSSLDPNIWLSRQQSNTIPLPSGRLPSGPANALKKYNLSLADVEKFKNIKPNKDKALAPIRRKGDKDYKGYYHLIDWINGKTLYVQSLEEEAKRKRDGVGAHRQYCSNETIARRIYKFLNEVAYLKGDN